MPQFQSVQFGKYFLLDRIATGGMAEVFKAKIIGEHGFEKIIIIKTLFPHLQSEKELVDSFIEEAKLAALLQHQNIVQIYDFGKVDESYFIAMEYLPGINLRTILNAYDDFPLSLENALFITQQICAGLSYAHQKEDSEGKHLQLIHRDVSPPNIIITDEGQLKIIDFGIARAASQNTSTQMGIIKGKVAYMSPEQAEGKHIDHRSDIFSTGILLYEMVSGYHMYKGDTIDVLSMARNAQFIPIEILCPNLPEAVKKIIAKALQKDVAYRYQSSNEMMNDIESCISILNFRPAGHKLAAFIDQILKETGAEKVKSDHPRSKDLKQRDPEKSEEAYKETVKMGVSTPSPLRRKKMIAAAVLFFLVVLVASVIFKVNTKTITPPKAMRDVPEETLTIVEPLPVERDILAEDETSAMEALQQERFHDAVMLFEKILAHDPSMEDRLKQYYTKALLGAASEFIGQENNMAREILLKVIKIDPANIQGHSQLGQIYVKMKDYKKAEDSYRIITELDDQFTDAFFNLGYIYAITKDFMRAETMYQKAVDLEPPYLDEALFNLAVVQDRLGKKETVAINLINALSINPKNKMVEKYLEKFNKRNGRK